MSMGAALKAERVLQLATQVIAIEVLCACQALDLLAPLETSPALRSVHACVRDQVPTLSADRPLSGDVAQITAMIRAGALEHASTAVVN